MGVVIVATIINHKLEHRAVRKIGRFVHQESPAADRCFDAHGWSLTRSHAVVELCGMDPLAGPRFPLVSGGSRRRPPPVRHLLGEKVRVLATPSPRHGIRFVGCVTFARPVIEGAVTALTRRTSFRKAMLGPWDPRVSQIWFYSFGLAAEREDVNPHHTNLVLSHQHSTVTARKKNLPRFNHATHVKTSKALNHLLNRRGIDAPGEIWDKRQPHVMRLLDVEAQMTHLVYERVQAVAAGLVDRPDEMPGLQFGWDLWLPGRKVVVPRYDGFFDSRTHPDEVAIDFVPPAPLLRAFGGDTRKLVYQMEKLTEDTCVALCRARKRPSRGAQRVQQIHPYDEPRTRREVGKRVPTFRLGARGIAGRQQRIVASVGVTTSRSRYSDSMDEYRDGNTDVVFPFGTYEMERLHGVNVELEPIPGCLVTGREEAVESGQHVELVEEARDALIDEAETMLLTRDFQTRGSQDVVVQGMESSRKTDVENPPRRVVVRRQRGPSGSPPRAAAKSVTEDERRARGSTTRRGNDPPVD